MENYYNWKGLEYLYLEDSYVLEIIEEYDKLIFKMEFVLLEEHELYHLPKPDEQYCYQIGFLELSTIKSKQWLEKIYPNNCSKDVNGEIDYDNIDAFYKDKGLYYLEGGWGQLKLQFDQLNVSYIIT